MKCYGCQQELHTPAEWYADRPWHYGCLRSTLLDAAQHDDAQLDDPRHGQVAEINAQKRDPLGN